MIEAASSFEIRDYTPEHGSQNIYCCGNIESTSDLIHAYYMLYPPNSASCYPNDGIRWIAQIMISW
jgi:hypothetical protein